MAQSQIAASNKYEAIIIGAKGGRSVWLRNPPPSCTDYLEILGVLAKCLELDRDGFAI